MELGRRLQDLPPGQSGAISLVLGASGLVAVGVEVVAVVSYARAVRRACAVRRLGIPPAIQEACTPGLLAVSGVHLSYRLYLKFVLVRWLEQAVRRAERRRSSSSAPHHH